MAMIPNRLSGVLTAAGLFTGTGAVLSASCCVLPLALGRVGAGASVFSALEAIAENQSYIAARNLPLYQYFSKIFPSDKNILALQDQRQLSKFLLQIWGII
jgi:hypothetical protein